ncbi:MAG: hypothetical protein ABGY75_03135 [Gemmataceae bacterium]
MHPRSLTRRQFFATTAVVAGAAATHAAVPPAPPPLAPEPPLPPGVFRRLGSARFRGPTGFKLLRFTADGRRVVDQSPNSAWVWDAETGRRTFAAQDEANRLAVVNHHLASADGTKKIVPNANGFQVTDGEGRVLSAGTIAGPYTSFQLQLYTVSNDGRWVAGECWHNYGSGGWQQEVVWDTTTGRIAYHLAVTNVMGNGADARVRFSGDNRTLFVMSRDGVGPAVLTALDVATGNVKRRYPAAPGFSFALSPDERTAVVYTEYALRVIDLKSGGVLPQSQDLFGVPGPLRFGRNGRILTPSTGWCPDQRTWVVWDRPDGAARTVEFDPTAARERLPQKEENKWVEFVPSLSLSPTAERYAAVGQFRTLIRDATTHRTLHTIRFPCPEWAADMFGPDPPPVMWVNHAHAWTPNGRFIAVVAHELLAVLDTRTGWRRSVELPDDLEFESLATSSDGNTIGGVCKQRNPKPGQPQVELATADLRSGHFTRIALPSPKGDWHSEHRLSPDFRRVLCHFSESQAPADFQEPCACMTSVFDVATKHTVSNWASFDEMEHATFTQDGRTVFLGVERQLGGGKGVEHALEAREVRTGERRWRVVLASECLSLDVSADGRELLTAHPDAPVYLWDVFGEKSDLQPFPGPKRLQSAWAELAGNGEAAFRAVRLLVQHPAAAVELLGEKLKPLARPTDTWVRGRVQELGDREYAVRAAAERQLVAVAEGIADRLDDFRGEVESAEAAERFERVLAAVKHPPEAVRACRAVEVLEHCRTSAAGKLLRALAAGPGGLTLTREAKEAVGRMG